MNPSEKSFQTGEVDEEMKQLQHVVEIVEYIDNAEVVWTIIRSTGSKVTLSFDRVLKENTSSPFDIFLRIIENKPTGKTE